MALKYSSLGDSMKRKSRRKKLGTGGLIKTAIGAVASLVILDAATKVLNK